jgi:hypothetical protein
MDFYDDQAGLLRVRRWNRFPFLGCSSLVLQELAQRLFTSYGHWRSEEGST